MSLIILDGAARVDANWAGMEGTRLGNEKYHVLEMVKKMTLCWLHPPTISLLIEMQKSLPSIMAAR